MLRSISILTQVLLGGYLTNSVVNNNRSCIEGQAEANPEDVEMEWQHWQLYDMHYLKRVAASEFVLR